MTTEKKISIIGSGNWGSAIARIVGKNVLKYTQFNNEVKMWVYEEFVDGRKLTEIINTEHENVKYLPNRKFPENVVAIPDICKATVDADIIIFVIPHQFVTQSCKSLVGKLKPDVHGISLIKGFNLLPEGGIELISHHIQSILNIPVSVLMGANLAHEVADEHFCETTIGCEDRQLGQEFKKLFHTDNFRVIVVNDVETVEVCGALKNIVACGSGFVEALNYGNNTKAAVIRIGLMEMMKFTEVFYPRFDIRTFFESCGIADLTTTCYGGRNKKISEAYVKTGKSVEVLEKELLGGQKAQGPETAAEVYFMLQKKKMEQSFPLFTAVHRIFIGELKPEDFIACLREHPEHM